MKNVLVLCSLIAVGLATTGCKSEIQKYADDLCNCKDKKCVEELDKAMEEKHKGEDKKELMKNISDKDKEAIAKAMECEMKLK